jgi:hypothetical protein
MKSARPARSLSPSGESYYLFLLLFASILNHVVRRLARHFARQSSRQQRLVRASPLSEKNRNFLSL